MDRLFFVAGSSPAFLAWRWAPSQPTASKLVSADMLTIFETGVRYHMYHALALLAVASASRGRKAARAPQGWAFIIGIVVFSGSLYIRSFTGMRWLGAITPIRGASFPLRLVTTRLGCLAVIKKLFKTFQPFKSFKTCAPSSGRRIPMAYSAPSLYARRRTAIRVCSR